MPHADVERVREREREREKRERERERERDFRERAYERRWTRERALESESY